MLETKTQTILDPLNYKAGVQQFFRFYNMKRQTPSLPFLAEILTHYAKLPYENISKIVKLHKNYTAPDRIRLPDEVIDDHTAYHLGGTCFSLTFTLQAILSDSGFLCYPFIAHMKNRPNSHCALVVLFDNKKYLVDPGYLINKPMEFHKDTSRWYHTEHTGVELVFNHEDETFNLFTFDHSSRKWRYQFQDVPLSMDEFLDFWWGSFYWSGMRGICLTQVNHDGMVYVHNDFVQVQNLQGKQKGHVEDIFRLVKETFEISPEWIERAQAAIPDIITRGQELGFYRKKS